MSGPLVDLAWTAAAIIAFGGCILRGGVHRAAGSIAGFVWALSLSVDRFDWAAERVLLFVFDLGLAGGLVWLTRTCRAPWLILTAASAVLLVVNYGVYALHPAVGGWAFVSVSWVWSACVLVGLLWGVVVGPGRVSRP